MSAAQPVRVFLSYARADRARVAKLAEALQAAGITLWWDTAIEGGASFSADIERELDAADVVVVAWSAASVKSDWVRDEAGAGRDRKRLVPVQLDATLPPLGFRQYQSINLSGWKGRADDANFASLVSAIHKLTGSAAAVPVPATPAPSRRALIGGGAALGAAAIAGGGWWFLRPGSAAATNTSIAVLPFANLSGDPAQAYFSDGIAEELRSALATIAGLKVAARTSSELMRDTDIKEAATKLGVAHVLTGSVRRGGGKIRVTAQLLDGVTGLESWSQAYDRPAGDVLDVQTGIAQSVANALSLQFGKAAALVGGTKNPAAYDAYLRADSNQFVDQDGYRTALADLNFALSADPNFALAHARLALLLVNLATQDLLPAARAAMFAKTIDAAERAIKLAPRLRMAYATIGRAHHLLLDFKRAANAFAKAATLPVTTGRGLVLEAFFQSEYWGRNAAALAIADQAVALDPLNQVPLRNRVRILMDGRQPEAALATIDAWDAAQTGNRMIPRYRIRALMMMGRPQEAAAVVELMADGEERLYWIAIIEAKIGNRIASEAALAALQQLPGHGPTSAAIIRSVQGELEMAFTQLALAVAQRDPGLARLRAEEAYNPLRNDARFIAIEKRLGFPPR
jgi:TolB-like protein